MAKVSSDITESFLSEVSELLEEARKDVLALKADPKDKDTLSRLLRNLHTIKGNSRMLGHSTIEKLSHAVEDIYKGVKDGQVKNSDRLVRLVFFVADKIAECAAAIRKKGTDEMNVDLYLQSCDKLAAGELVDIDSIAEQIRREKEDKLQGGEDEEDEEDQQISDIQSIRIKLSRI
ncbi:MAG: Hpt domain-containing protein, partial [Treponema sp.]|nr:Hpt domain-containing protein [Treponema sp.]